MMSLDPPPVNNRSQRSIPPRMSQTPIRRLPPLKRVFMGEYIYTCKVLARELIKGDVELLSDDGKTWTKVPNDSEQYEESDIVKAQQSYIAEHKPSFQVIKATMEEFVRVRVIVPDVL